MVGGDLPSVLLCETAQLEGESLGYTGKEAILLAELEDDNCVDKTETTVAG